MSKRSELLKVGLGPTEADVVSMRVRGAAVEDVAAALGLRPRSVRRTQRRAMEKLARALCPDRIRPGAPYVLLPSVEDDLLEGRVDPAMLPPGYAEAAVLLAEIRQAEPVA